MESLTKDQLLTPEQRIRYYSENQVSIAAAFGGPFAGGWLLAKNLERSGRSPIARRILATSIAGLLSLLLVAMFLPTDFPNSFGSLVVGAAFYGWYRHSFYRQFQEHIETGGEKESSWKVVGAVVASLPVTIVALFAVTTLVPIKPMNYLPIGENFVYYEGEADRNDAERLSRFLTEYGVLAGVSEWEIGLEFPRNAPGEAVLKAPMEPPVEASESYLAIQELVDVAERELFPGKQVTFHVLNEYGFYSMKIDNE